jgi:hypothetical protein
MRLCVRGVANRIPYKLMRFCAIPCLAALLLTAAAAKNGDAPKPFQTSAQNPATRPVGTVKSINGKTIVLTTDAGAEVTVQLQDDTKLVRIAPGEKDLKNAAPLSLQDLQAGDRILVRGALAPDGKTVMAASLIAMKQADVAAKQARDREEWQRQGVGGLVTKIDEPGGTITVSTNATGAAKDVTIHVTPKTALRRYAADSVKFDDAKPAPLSQVKLGDQLRARGSRSPDGADLTADEIVSGTFRNIAGTINSVDSSAGTITITDLISKRPVTVKIGGDAQLRKLPPMMAQLIAMRLKGGSAEGAAGSNPTGGQAQRPAEGAPATQPNSQGSPGAAVGQGAGRSGAPGGPGGAPAGGAGTGRGDVQQMLGRLPSVTLADLQKGDAVMIVTTEGTPEKGVTAITLLTGVEPILQAAPAGGASSILTPWSLGSAPSGDASP